MAEINRFYELHTHIKESHGLKHVMAVYNHATKAVACHSPPLSSSVSMEIEVASLLHDVDDEKYFPNGGECTYPNAGHILQLAGIPDESSHNIINMIDVVSCSKNGNSVPNFVKANGDYHFLIPRWSDRLEAVGAIGVVRCFQYNQERNRPMSSDKSPRSKTVEEVWEHATPDRFEAYQKGGNSTDMISHYYDKLLHIARPPPDIVRNKYLEQMAEESVKELLEICIRFGKTGMVDEKYIQKLLKLQE
eukprot:CAMPEP_0195525824 /NCGR_PEP_ID=MMETSP0794_2-20130614/26461_1 /TAXON_ID=515487 /ORGANISM="Stephanopyxis turris, Strain CCMP 815" /LENGTH=247 /DNA_ID=CAMNT_0040656365 /DNA_START=415 /DNA_END=1158 /DNA_ORIENTATION=+